MGVLAFGEDKKVHGKPLTAEFAVEYQAADGRGCP